MLAILFLLGSAVFGFCVVRRALANLLDLVEQLWWGVITGWVLTSLGVYLAAHSQGHLNFRLILWATILILLIAAILATFEFRRKQSSVSTFSFDVRYTGLAFVLILLAPVYWRLLSFQVFAPGAGGVYSGGAGNDLSFHAALASSFAYGQNFPPVYLLLPPERLFYPFMPDFQVAILMATGMSLRAAMIVTALGLGATIAGLFYSFALRIARLPRVATLATTLFLLNGGLGFIQFIRDWKQSDKSTIQFWNTLPFNYAKISELGLHWTNIVADMLVPQRTSLFGLSMGLMVLTIFAVQWQRWHHLEELDRPKSPRGSWLMLIAGLLTGILPLFHTHTFIALGLLSATLFVLKPQRAWLWFWIPALVLSAPQLVPLALHAKGSGIVRPFFGWLGHDDHFFPLYLLRNLGLPLLLAIPAWWVAPRPWRKFYLAFLFLLVFPFVIVFSPNLFDNGKLLYYWHAFNSVIVAAWLIRLTKRVWLRPLVVLLTFFSIATALLVFHSETIGARRMFSDEDLTAAEFIRNQTPPHALFLTAPALQSPAVSLAGRQIVRGATAWLWSHGYEFRERESDVRRIYSGAGDALDLLRYYNVDYVYLGDAERSDVRANSQFFEANFPVVFRSATVSIYDLRKLHSPSATSPPGELASRLDRDPYALIVEFPQTSFLVYRLCKASYGRMPRRAEFMTAMSLLTRGVFVGAPGRESQLLKNLSALLDDWVASPEFKQSYDGKSDAEFVDALFRNAGISVNAAKRQAFMNEIGSRPDWRQAALFRIAEDKDFYVREYNNAWVLVHFFGYLRRNPDDAPDYDLKGFNFWRDRLNSWGDYRTISLAFMDSIEYRNLQPAP